MSQTTRHRVTRSLHGLTRWLPLLAFTWLVLGAAWTAGAQGLAQIPRGGIADPGRLYDLEHDEALLAEELVEARGSPAVAHGR